jgi:hypothetical protein
LLRQLPETHRVLREEMEEFLGFVEDVSRA